MNFERYHFVKHRNKFFAVSIALALVGVLMLALFGLNFGVDFKAGTTLDITLDTAADREQTEQLFQEAGLPQPVVTIGGEGQDRITARFDTVLEQEQIRVAIDAVKAQYGEAMDHEENTVDPQLAREMGIKAIIGILIACVGISLYVSVRFEWRFALAAVVTLLYDAFIVITIFAIFRLEVNLPFVAAVLTIVGYSINDKIVIFDRIRDNLRFAKLKTADDLSQLINKSLWQTMTRSVNTGITVVFSAACLLIFGSEALKLFSLAMLVGLVSGMYSSICLASTFYYILRRNALGTKRTAVEAKANS